MPAIQRYESMEAAHAAANDRLRLPGAWRRRATCVFIKDWPTLEGRSQRLETQCNPSRRRSASS